MKLVIILATLLFMSCSISSEVESNSITGVVIVGDKKLAAKQTVSTDTYSSVEVVLVSAQAPSETLQRTDSDEDGFYSFTGLGDGEYIVISNDNWQYGGVQGNISLSGGTNRKVTIEMKPFQTLESDGELTDVEWYFYSQKVPEDNDNVVFYYLDDAPNVYTAVDNSIKESFIVQIGDEVDNDSDNINDTGRVLLTPYKANDQMSSFAEPVNIESSEEGVYEYYEESSEAYVFESFDANEAAGVLYYNDESIVGDVILVAEDEPTTIVAQIQTDAMGNFSFLDIEEGEYLIVAQVGDEYGGVTPFTSPGGGGRRYFSLQKFMSYTYDIDEEAISNDPGELTWFGFKRDAEELVNENNHQFIEGVQNVFGMGEEGEKGFYSIETSGDTILFARYPNGDYFHSGTFNQPPQLQFIEDSIQLE